MNLVSRTLLWLQRRTQSRRDALVSRPPAGLEQVIHCSMDVAPGPALALPTLGDFLKEAGGPFVPAALLAQKAKAVSDGIVAALEKRSTEGDPADPGLNAWLVELQARLPDGSAAAHRIRAALEIATLGTTLERAASTVPEDSVRSRPIGFYTWDVALGRGFRRDRFLQELLPGPEADEIARAVASDAALRRTYAHHLRRIARLSDALSKDILSLEGRIASGRGPGDEARREALYPPSGAVESGFHSIADFFAAVRNGKCDLKPTAESGFYAHQRFVLTSLLLPERTPEAAARTLDAEYKAALERLAALAFFFARETHVKRLELPRPTMAPVPTRLLLPELTVEPLPSFYRLTADAFRFLRRVVVEGWGEEALASPQLRASGPVSRTVLEGIDDVVGLCTAAADLSRCEIAGQGQGAETEALRARLATLRSDPDVTGDARGLVPLEVDFDTGKVRVAAFVGWERRRLRVAITHRRNRPPATELGSEWHLVPVPVVREAWVNPGEILERDQLRAICDRLAAAESMTEESLRALLPPRPSSNAR